VDGGGPIEDVQGVVEEAIDELLGLP
jgi:hypothetical protein